MALSLRGQSYDYDFVHKRQLGIFSFLILHFSFFAAKEGLSHVERRHR